MTTRLIVADDHVIFRQGLVALLSAEEGLEIIGVADNGLDALDLLRVQPPDIAILDISMPGQGAIEICEIVANERLPTRIIALTMHKETLIVNRAVAASVAGYVLKDNAFADLIYAIKAVTDGGTFISPSIAGVAVGVKTSTAEQLTRREREVLTLITGGRSNRQISAELFISIKTVETHRARMMRKLDLHNTADLVRYALQNGLE